MRKLRPVTPRGPIYADDFNAIAEQVTGFDRMDVDGPPGTELSRSGGNPKLIIPRHPRRIRARIITTNTLDVQGCSTAYSWWEQRPIQGGCWEDIPEAEGGRRGDAATEPAFEANGIELTQDVNTWLYPGHVLNLSTSVQQSWYFDAPATCCIETPVLNCEEILARHELWCLTVPDFNINGTSVIGDNFQILMGQPFPGLDDYYGSIQVTTDTINNYLIQFRIRCVNDTMILEVTPPNGAPIAAADFEILTQTPLHMQTTSAPGCYTVQISSPSVQICLPATVRSGPCTS